MFMGTTYNSIDEKNRVIVPSKLRSEMGTHCVITKGLDRCLYIYTMEHWNVQMRKIEALPTSDPKVRAFIRHFCANACECEFDRQGRVLIPSELKQYALIEKELVTMGAMDKVEIWAKEEWEKPSNDSRMDIQDFSNALAEYNF